MANLKLKDINQLDTWNNKELRKLRITIKNRISSYEASPKPKELPLSHPLHQKDLDFCKELLEKVLKAERLLNRA